jgi:hypothetical protein
MFPEDEGDLTIRSTVHLFALTKEKGSKQIDEGLSAFSENLSMFDVPNDFYQEIDTKHKHEIYHSTSLALDLGMEIIGHHALWGHFITNSAMLLAQEIESGEVPLGHFQPTSDLSSADQRLTFKGLRVLELGCGSALPSILALVFLIFGFLFTKFSSRAVLALFQLTSLRKSC